MANRAKPKSAKKKAATGKVPSRGTVATLPKRGKGKKRGIGDNSDMHAVPDETILRAIETLRTKKRAMKKAQEELDQVKGVYRSARKKAKADGLNMDAFDLIEALENQDQGSVLINHADAGRYLKLTESPLALQMELFQNLSAPAPKVDANLQGQQAGKNAVKMPRTIRSRLAPKISLRGRRVGLSASSTTWTSSPASTEIH